MPSLDRISLGEAYDDIVKHLADFSLLRHIVHQLPVEKYYPLEQRRGMDAGFYNSDEYKALQHFLDMFEDWYGELATNKRAFAPLNPGDGKRISSWVKGTNLDAKDDSYLLLGILNASRKEKEQHSNRLRFLLKFAYQAIDHYTKPLIRNHSI